MKKIFLSIGCIFFIVSLWCSSYIKEWVSPERTVTKSISLRIVHPISYKNRIYRNSSAMLNIVVISLHGNTTDTLLTKNYPDVKLKNLPSYSEGFKQNIFIPGVLDKKEQIIVLYTIKYISKGSVLTIPNAKYIGKGITHDNVLIQI